MTRYQLNIITKRASYFSIGLALSLAIALQPAFVFAADPGTTSTDPSTTTTTPTDPTQQTLPATDPSAAPLPAPDPAPVPAPTPPPPPTTPGTQQPTGAAANTFHYNADTGMWENDYYQWNPYTRQTTPKNPIIYTCNPNTNRWDYSQWIWNAAAGSYQQQNFSTANPPASASTVPCPPSPAPAAADTTNTDSPKASDPTLNTSMGTSNNTANLSVGSDLNSVASSGNASVTSNTVGGSALTGNATDIANIMNLLQSTSSLAGAGATTFVSNINGDVNGNLLIDPSLLQPATSQTDLASNINVNNMVNGQIDNNIALNAQTGNADVTNNTAAGNATSGSANAVADVVNLMNSAVSAGQSFLGTINIYGNLTGDILVPQQLLDSLLANNAPQTTLDTSTLTNGNMLDQFNNSTNQNIANNVTTTAATGNANVTGNTSAGSATTGTASTNVTIFNLTGQQIVGSNSLLVFVNVLGKWVGLIMNAPQGSTAAEIGGGITQNSNNANTSVNSTSNEAITNNITANAQSGDATVNHNSTAGNATTGNATASANIANISNSSLNLSNWFGMLFINVFGSWVGNFGTFDNSPPPTSPSSTTPTASASPTNNPVTNAIHAFHFVPTGNNKFTLAAATVPDNTQVLGSHTKKNTPIITTNTANTQLMHTDHFQFLPLAAGITFVLILVGYELYTVRKQNRAQTIAVTFS